MESIETQVVLPNYKLIRYEVTTMTEGKLQLYFRLLDRYRNNIKALYEWFASLTEEQLFGIGLRIAGSSKKFKIMTLWREDRNIGLINKILDIDNITYIYNISVEVRFNRQCTD